MRTTGALPAGDDRHRPGADADPDAARARRGGEVRGVLRRRPLVAARRGPRDALEHVPRVRGDRVVLPVRRQTLATCATPAAATSWTWSSATRRNRGSSAPTATPSRCSARRSASTCPRSSRRVAGPRRPQDRVPLPEVPGSFVEAFRERLDVDAIEAEAARTSTRGSGRTRPRRGWRASARRTWSGPRTAPRSSNGSVVIAAITSCTNTSNPSVMLAAGLLAQEGGRGGPRVEAVGEDVARAGVARGHRLPRPGRAHPVPGEAGVRLVGYGCTTCIGNSGPLPDEVAKAVDAGDLTVVAVLSGNRNFEGRIHPQVRASYLASPPLCVAYALAGRVDVDLTSEPLGTAPDGTPVFLRDLWPIARRGPRGDGRRDRARAVRARVRPDLRRRRPLAADARRPRARCTRGIPARRTCRSRRSSRTPAASLARSADIEGARVLVKVGDSVTTDHISPAGSIKADSPAGRWLQEQGVQPARLQLVRRAARQPRGDDARDVRQHPPAQRAGAGHRGPVDDPPALAASG